MVMVPVMALEATTATFVGHNWGKWRRSVGAIAGRRVWPACSYQDMLSEYSLIHTVVTVAYSNQKSSGLL